ncbi:uncharacterized protein MKK02DRAFT_43586 [Dioszegia hungarica]|uniref:Transmembrane protein n=1 Tax=Dioszegia hungarica TaxID=4972 RepID=A0AA38HEW7_9TREE|nr:uncharacterized protein MKK02DRAFT_43586 [Dioszegia hungarica]KAI9637659.1 hypothetical protein MKK02DRAFT_43586 [Dioszegia hungarica]
MASATATKEPPAAPASSSTLQKAKVNLSYLALGSAASVAPSSLATRSFLTTTRYVLRYAIRRLIRYAKYAAVGAVAALIGGSVLGTLGSGVAFFAAPGLLGGMGIGVLTAVGKFGWRHRGNWFRGGYFEGMRQRAAEGHDGAADEHSDAGSVERAANAENNRRKEDVWMRA